MGPGGASPNGSRGSLMDLPIEFRLLLIAALVFVVISLGLSRIVQGQGGHKPPRWARRWGLMVEFIASALGVVATWAAAIIAAVADFDPQFGGVLIALVSTLPGLIGLRSFFELGRQRAWVWVIRSDESMHKRFAIAFFIGLLIVIAVVIGFGIE